MILRGRGGAFIAALVLAAVCPAVQAQAPGEPDPAAPAPAEAAPADGSAAGAAVADPLDPVASTLELDIGTSTLLELAAWCRELGLPESGTKEELARRLRDHFGLSGQKAGGGQASGTPAQTGAGEKPAAPAGAAAPRVVVVESAQGTEYFTLEAVNEEYARLRGGVVLSFKDGETVHRIRAQEVLFNRTRNTLSAVGGVEYEKSGSFTTERFRGHSLTVDVDDWSGIFLDGASEKGKTGEATAYRFSGEVISRVPEDVTVLQDATVTTAAGAETDNYWSLEATRIWLLPGSEWAIANALLKVGEIPVLYIPFFYLPGDELVFHPVLGYRSREGSFVQTTTYLVGRPKAVESGEASIMNLMQGDEGEEKVRQGIFLRRTGRRAPPDSGASLSLLLDAYANLGYYLGLNAAAPKGKLLSKAELSAGIGFSRDLYQLDSYYYSPFTEEHPNGVWNESRFLQNELPFRYRFLSTGTMTLPEGSLAWNLPFYSDPYINQDFFDRTENMNWLSMIKNGVSSTDDGADESSVDVLGSYAPSVSGSYKLESELLKPYINTLALTSFKSALTLRVQSSSELSYPSIDRTFFYPEKLTPISLSASITGKPLSLGSPAQTGAQSSPAGQPAAAPPSAFGLPRSPWEEDPAAAVPAGQTAEPESAAPGTAADSGPDRYVPPALSQTFSSSAGGAPRLDLSYTLTPSFSTDIVYDTAPWTEAADVDWDSLASTLVSAQNGSSVVLSLSSPQSTVVGTFTLTNTAAWQHNAYLNERSSDYDTEEELDAAALRNYQSTYSKTTGAFSLTIKPFLANPVWSGTYLGYLLQGRLVDTFFDAEATAADPEWEEVWGEWTEESVTTHQASVNLAALVRDLTQDLKVSTDLEPRPSQIAGAGNLRVWKSTTSASLSVTELEDGGTFQPVTLTETLDLGKTAAGAGRTFTQRVVYDPEEDEYTSASSTLSFGNFSSAFTASKSVGYSLDPESGWIVSDTEQKLRPQTFTAGYKAKKTVGPAWKNRSTFTFDANSSFSFDFQRYTQSYFTFALSSTVKVFEFLDLTFATTSRNSVVFRYFQDLPYFDLPLEISGEENPLVDLVDSFNFFDTAKRRSSGFKMKTLSVSAKHYLGDWTAELSYTLEPYLDSTLAVPSYVFNHKVSFLVKWVPVPDFKTQTYSDEDGFAIK
jgi:hypothetical protein